MDEILRWYIKQAIELYLPEEDIDEALITSVIEHPEGYPQLLITALELAVKDVG